MFVDANFLHFIFNGITTIRTDFNRFDRFYFYTRDIVRLLYIHGCLLLRLGPKRAIPLNIK